MAKFDAAETQILGISMDSFASNKEFAKQIGVTFPLLSDWKRDATKAYGLYNEVSGYGRRGTFVIDKEGIIQHVEVGNTAIDPTGAYQVCDLLLKKKAAAPKQ
jgi:peroxiredoxin